MAEFQVSNFKFSVRKHAMGFLKTEDLKPHVFFISFPYIAAG